MGAYDSSSWRSPLRIVDPDARTSSNSEEFFRAAKEFDAVAEIPLTTRRGGEGDRFTDRAEAEASVLVLGAGGTGGYAALASVDSWGIAVLLYHQLAKQRSDQWTDQEYAPFKLESITVLFLP